MNAGNTSPSVAQHPGKTVSWHLDAHPGDGLQPSGARGSSKDRGAWVEEGVDMGLDVFSVIVPDWAGASPRLSNPNAGKGCRQKKGAVEDEMVRQHR